MSQLDRMAFAFVLSNLTNHSHPMEFERRQLNFREAFLKATELCSQSEKCAYDIEVKCREWQLSPADTATLIETLEQEKFIDPQRYANSFVRDKFKFNKWGKIKIAYLLRQKHLSNQVIQTALDELDEEAYLQVLHELLVTKARTVKEKEGYARRNKLTAFVQSRGFEADIAIRLLRDI